MSDLRELLDDAAAVAGSREAIALNSKAFSLLADDAARTATPGLPIDVAEFDITGRFAKARVALLDAIATGVGARLATYDPNVIVFGTAAHLEQVRFLFDALLPQMLTGASGAVASKNRQMLDFAYRIRDLLLMAGQNTAAVAPDSAVAWLANDSQRAFEAVEDFAATLGVKVQRTRGYTRNAEVIRKAG